jgi:hypothetical protein
MASRRVTTHDQHETRRPPATTPEARENQMISLSVDLAEKQLRDGTASSQVISHFLKLGSSREKLEQARLAQEVELMAAKSEAIAAAGRVEELYGKALDAMRSYAGQEPIEQEEQFDD